MDELIFCPPEGGIIHNPDVEFVRQIFLAQDDAYWLRGSAEAGLHFKAGQQESQMIVRFRKALGFCVYFEASRAVPPLVLCSKPDDEQIIELTEGGNTLRLPKSYFVPFDVAWPALAEFMKSGKALPHGQWTVFLPRD